MTHSISNDEAIGSLNLFTLSLVISVIISVYGAIHLSLSGYAASQFKDVLLFLMAMPLVYIYMNESRAKKKTAIDNLVLLLFILIFASPVHSLAVGNELKLQMLIHPTISFVCLFVFRKYNAVLLSKYDMQTNKVGSKQ